MIFRRILNVFVSTRMMAMLFVTLAVAMAVGTFVEDRYDTITARAWIYAAWWFELIMILFVINFIGNIKRYRLHWKKDWAVLMLHLSWILIIIGAGVTRYISYEGIMPIREGATENTFLSEYPYVKMRVVGPDDSSSDPEAQLQAMREKRMVLSQHLDNKWSYSDDFLGRDYKVELVEFIPNAEASIQDDPAGKNYLKIVESGDGGRHTHFLEEGQVANIHNLLFALNMPTDGAVNITVDESGYTIKSPFAGNYMRMADQLRGELAADSLQPLQLRSLYTMGEMGFVFPDPMKRGTFTVAPVAEGQRSNEDGVLMDVTYNGKTERLGLLGGRGTTNPYENATIDDLSFDLAWGSKEHELPFSLTLQDFIAEKHPGTLKGYSAFKSKVFINEDGEAEPYEIYMNHVLDHGGFRFFQSGFDPDEKGTKLAVNHDSWGKWITYTGYILLYLGLMGILFQRGTRFTDLKEKLKKVRAKKAALHVLVVAFLSFSAFAKAHPAAVKLEDALTVVKGQSPVQQVTDQVTSGEAAQPELQDTPEVSVEAIQSPQMMKSDDFLIETAVPDSLAAQFADVIIQDNGRMKPVNTYASELIRSISKQESHLGLTPEQTLLSMMMYREAWYSTELIELPRGNDSLRKMIGVPSGTKRVQAVQFFDEQGRHKLADVLEDAYNAEPKNAFQTDFVKVNERLVLLNGVLSGGLLKFYPKQDAPNNTWYSFPERLEAGFKGRDSVFVTNSLPLYFQGLQIAKEQGDTKLADEVLTNIKAFQRINGAAVYPKQSKIDGELLYNAYDPFKSLYKYYALIGIVMFLFLIWQMLYPGKIVDVVVTFFKWIVVLLFVYHTLALIGRWYISGHAPWSDAYESMIYVAWATMGFGLVFGRRSELTIASTAFVASMILWVAHMNWMDPSISNLQPVLDSYWLMIHVAVIVGSYGPFALGMILGLVSLFLMIFINNKNRKRFELNLQELVYVNEMALTVGLVMLTIGNFLGGMWANESWGRYWGWDPKETWALISIMVYAFVIHMRFVPGLRGKFAFNLASVVAFASVMMTYFGVNFYLKGLHSYASGDQIISYQSIVIAAVLITILGVLASWRYNLVKRKH